MSTYRQRMLDALCQVQERRAVNLPLRMAALVPVTAPADRPAFWNFEDNYGRTAFAFAMNSEEATDIACELLEGAKQIKCTRLRSESGTPFV